VPSEHWAKLATRGNGDSVVLESALPTYGGLAQRWGEATKWCRTWACEEAIAEAEMRMAAKMAQRHEQQSWAGGWQGKGKASRGPRLMEWGEQSHKGSWVNHWPPRGRSHGRCRRGESFSSDAWSSWQPRIRQHNQSQGPQDEAAERETPNMEDGNPVPLHKEPEVAPTEGNTEGYAPPETDAALNNVNSSKLVPPTHVSGDASDDSESPNSSACPRNNTGTQGCAKPRSHEHEVGAESKGTDSHVADLDNVDERRIEPETGRAFTFVEFAEAFSGQYSSDEIREYWRDACTRVTDIVQ